MHGAVWTMIHTVISVPIAFLVNLLVARLLGTTGYGRLAYLTAVMEIAGGIVALGLMSGVIQFGAKAHATGDTQRVRHLLSASQGFRLLVGAPVLTAVILAVADVGWGFLAVAIVFGVWVPAALAGASACLQIENKTASDAKIALVTGLLVQAVVVLTVLLTRDADSVWAARLVSASLVVVLALVPIAPTYRRAVLRPRFPRGFPAGFWAFAIPTGVAALVGRLVLSRSEVLFLEWLGTTAQVGVFALAFGLATHLFAPAQALMGPLIPAVSALREVDGASVGRAFTRTLRAGSTVVGLLLAFFLPTLSVLVPTLYGAQFAGATLPLLVLGLSVGIQVSTGPVSAFVLSRLSARRILSANLVALAVDVALAVALIPPLGIWGAVVANVSGMVTRLTILLLDELRSLQMTVREALTHVAPLVLAAVAVLAAWAAVALLPDSAWTEVPVGFVVGATTYLVLLTLFRSGLTAEDAAVVSRALPARFRRPGTRLLGLLTRRPPSRVQQDRDQQDRDQQDRG